jgi:hypothetical protein
VQTDGPHNKLLSGKIFLENILATRAGRPGSRVGRSIGHEANAAAICAPGTTEGGVVNTSEQPQDVVLVVDIANVMGSRPDGWWRDRAAAATSLLGALEPLSGVEVILSDLERTVRITQVRAVLEGAAKRAEEPAAVSVLRADRDGDAAIVEEAHRLTASGTTPLVVTADRGLQRRLPEQALIAGPGWLNRLLRR